MQIQNRGLDCETARDFGTFSPGRKI